MQFIYISFFCLGETLAEGLLVLEQALTGCAPVKLYIEHVVLVALCCLACALVLFLSSSSVMLWLCVALFSMCNGPTSGLIFSICHQLTITSDRSTSIMMIGMCLGEGFTPYITSSLWAYTKLGSSAMFLSLLILMALSLVVLLSPLVAYSKADRIGSHDL